MSGDKQQLLAMGFEEARIDWALKATKRSGLQPAMDHLLNNSDNPVPSDSAQPEDVDSADEDSEELKIHVKKTGASEEPTANSIKCSECGKIFKSSATASFHAERSGHQEFEESTEEIKPLTEEEKKAKLADMRQKLAEKRALQSKIDAKETRANDVLRRKAGQDQDKIKEDMMIKEMHKEVDRKKREKIEDQKARAAIKAQIEADKRERAAKVAREKAIRDGEATPAAASAPAAAAAKPVTNSAENPQTRLQVRLSSGGAPLTKTFPSESTLVDVAEWIASENLAYNVDTVTFASTFPRKTFSRDEMRKSLKANGLTPSAVLNAS
ncbi:ubiquitin-related domain-containing protein [Dioszegia hungarica]|uniref:Ubiquitin-related domain-containing protein n=1 Tax=Dioszegia hungarica TaxID=4972 RepID=A0AA38HGL0_9TREE|nr:ubiquitin-related domain-containing protein [Dioszegia hungarica]KAI9639116.1 ubiquitin-related domain-containing protein [Dioszegia hungarica]